MWFLWFQVVQRQKLDFMSLSVWGGVRPDCGCLLCAAPSPASASWPALSCSLLTKRSWRRFVPTTELESSARSLFRRQRWRWVSKVKHDVTDRKTIYCWHRVFLCNTFSFLCLRRCFILKEFFLGYHCQKYHCQLPKTNIVWKLETEKWMINELSKW